MWNWIGMSALAAGALVCLAAAPPVVAQSQSAQGLVDRKLYDGRTVLNKNALRFCLATASPLRDLDRALGEAIAQIQLAHVEFYDVDLTIPQQDDDFDRLLFVSLTDHCDAMMGTDLAWSPLPEWLTVSRPYYSAPYVLAVRPNTYSSLGGVPPGGRIGSPVQHGRPATRYHPRDDVRRQALERVPYADVPSMLADVRWPLRCPSCGPGQVRPAGWPDAGFQRPRAGRTDAPWRPVPQQEHVHRDAVDQAIALQQDGTIDRVIAEQGLPGRQRSE
jgi:hypothetical protein